MKKSLFLSAVCMGCVTVVQAATISLSEFTTGTDSRYSFSSTNITSVTADQITGWLSAKSDGWYATPANGNSGTTVFQSVNPQEDGSSDLQFINRNAYKGSVVGLKLTLTDYADYNTLNFNVNFNSIGNGATGFTINLVYETSEGWQISTLSTTKTDLDSSDNKMKTVSADISQTPLISGSVYAVITSQSGGGSANTVNVSLQGEKVIPEPATATLGLLGLAALMVRRRKA